MATPLIAPRLVDRGGRGSGQRLGAGQCEALFTTHLASKVDRDSRVKTLRRPKTAKTHRHLTKETIPVYYNTTNMMLKSTLVSRKINSYVDPLQMRWFQQAAAAR